MGYSTTVEDTYIACTNQTTVFSISISSFLHLKRKEFGEEADWKSEWN